jgi:hypothetical protein
MPTYDLFVYRNMDDPIHDAAPAVGQDASQWFGKGFEGLYVTAVAPGIHSGRVRRLTSRRGRSRSRSAGTEETC